MKVKDSPTGVKKMRILSDSIESFIKALMTEDDARAEVEVRRNELAAHFGCAPSQINYVLSTRFTPNHGYLIESRRGGGGYIRIVRIASDDRQGYIRALYERIEDTIGAQEAAHIIENLRTANLVTTQEAELMTAALMPTTVPLPLSVKEMMYAGIMRSFLLSLAKRKPEC